jgi:DNA repair exonuclease SbcCD ATPase subunit
MNDNKHSEIKRLKDELQEAKKGHAHWQALLPQRESLQDTIEKMQNGIEEACSRLESQSTNTSEATTALQNEIEKQRSLLKRIKKQKQEMDHLLDNLEEGSEERVETIYKQLVKAILASYPDQQPIYRLMEENHNKIVNELNSLSELMEICEKLRQSLDKINVTRQNVRKQGLLRYLFGQNPNVIIAQELHNLSELCESSFSIMDAHESDKDKSSDSYKELRILMQNLYKHTKQRWGFKTIDTIFTPALSALSSIQPQIDERLKVKEGALKKSESKFEEWLKDFN